MRHIDPETVDAAVQPVPQDRVELGEHLLVAPVEVRLLGGEQVEVPLPVRDSRPRAAAEDRQPVVGRLCAVRAAAGPENVTIALGRAWRPSEGGAKPGMAVRGVVRHDVDDHLEAVRMRVPDQLLEVLERPEHRVHVAVIGDVVPAVGLRRRVERGEPDRVHAEIRQVRHPRADARQVAVPVTVAVGEAADIRLVAHRPPPPRLCRHCHRFTML
jgi:hypothetical protein